MTISYATENSIVIHCRVFNTKALPQKMARRCRAEGSQGDTDLVAPSLDYNALLLCCRDKENSLAV